MALAPKFSISPSDDCKSWLVYDKTGIYNALTNTGGFSSPNPTVASVTAAALTITKPDGTVLSPINLYPQLPNTNNIAFEILNTDLGYGADEKIPDGAWFFDYILTGNSGGAFTAELKCYKYQFCAACCCLSKLAAKAKPGDCNCENDPKDTFSDAFDLLELAKDAAGCGKRQMADEFMAELTLVCNAANCGCS